MPDVTAALATLTGAGWVINAPSKYVGGNGLSQYTWANKPAASAVPFGTQIRITDFGVAPGIIVVSDGVNWTPDGLQLLGRGNVQQNLTGTLAETTLATVSVPAGLMLTNGGLLIASTWTNTNSANNKFPRMKLDGQAALTPTLTATATFADIRRIRNRNAAGVQIVSTSNATPNSVGATVAAATVLGVDTTLAKDITFTGQLALVGESLALETYEVWATP